MRRRGSIPMGAPWPVQFPELLERMVLVIFSGLLVGLGGPFWFDTFRKLSSIAGVVRALPPATTEMKPEDAVSTMTPLQVFQKALKVQLLASPADYAALQQPLVTPLKNDIASAAPTQTK